MDLRPEEKFLRFSELSENRALKPFAHFCVQPAAPGLINICDSSTILSILRINSDPFKDLERRGTSWLNAGLNGLINHMSNRVAGSSRMMVRYINHFKK